MRKTFYALSALLLSSTSFAADLLSLGDTPAAVQSKIEHLQFGELIRCYAYKGGKLYKFHFKDDQNEAEVKISSDGLLVEVEAVTPLASLTKAQQKAILDGGKRGDLDKLESVTGYFYEVEIMDMGVEKEIKIDDTGMILEIEVEDDGEEDNEDEHEDEDIAFLNTPQSVQSTILSLAPQAPEDIEKEIVESGRVLYEAKFTKYGQVNELKIGAQGELIEDERALALTSLPSFIVETLKLKFPQAKLKKAEFVKFYMFEAFFKQEGQTWEYKIHPDGELISSKQEK